MSAELFSFPIPAKKPKPQLYTTDFLAFWNDYPRKLNCSKLMAFKAWQKLSGEDQSCIASVLPTFIRSCAGKDEQYIPHPVTWINQRRFETVQVAVKKADMPALDMAALIRIYLATGRWNRENGPEPIK